MLQKIVKQLNIEIPQQIIDDETGVELPFEENKVKRALEIISDFQHHIKHASVLVSEFFNEKLHLYIGLSKSEAAERFFGMSLRSVERLQRIGEVFGKQVEQIAHLGIAKLDMLATLPEDEIEKLLHSKTLKLADGTELSLDEIEQAKVKELERKLREEIRKNSRLNVQIKEMEEEYKSEIKELKDEINHMDKMLNIPSEDRKFYKKITSVREARTKLFEVQSNIHAAFLTMMQLELNNEIAAEIESTLTLIAKRLLDMEAYFIQNGMDVSLGYRRDGIKQMAGVK
ncbi:MAG: hypothetical protein WHV26_03605 [Spirochaetota bacterium]|jgi:hypothetical protein